MKNFTAAILFLFTCFNLFAEDDKISGIPESVSLKTPAITSTHGIKLTPGADYALSAKVSSSTSRSALIEIRLFKNDRQCKYLRSVRSTVKESVLENVFNAGSADRAEVTFRLIDDAMPGSSAQFKDIRMVICQNTAFSSWTRNPPVNCNRQIKDDGRTVVITPLKKNSGYCTASVNKLPQNSRLRFSARAKCDRPGLASLAVNCGKKNSPSKHFKSPWTTKTNEVITLEFDTQDSEWCTLLLRSLGTKKHRLPVEFSEIKFEIISPVTAEKTTDKTANKGNNAK